MRSRNISALAAAFMISVGAAAAPVVVSVAPTPNAITVAPSAHIVVTFSEPIAQQTVHAITFKVFGHWSGVPQGQFFFESGGTVVRFVPSRPFSAGELVTVSLAKGIENTNGVPMSQGYAWTFWAQTLPGSMDLQLVGTVPVRRQGEGHIQSYGAYSGDFNGDGHLDLAIPNEISDDVRVFLNDGFGMYDTFAVYPLPNGNTPSPNEGADFNSDGIIDYAVGNAGNDRLTILIGDGSGGFSSLTSYQAASAVRGVAIMDLDGDGHTDVVTANRNGNNLSLFRGIGDGTFAPRVNMEGNGSNETAVVAADMNNDGILDAVVGYYGSNEVGVLLGDGNGGLTFHSKIAANGKPWMLAVGDLNGDGNIDVVSANSSFNNAGVYLGNGTGALVRDSNYAVGSFPLAIDLGDIDGDGDLDMVTSQYGSGTWTVYENNGTGRFFNRRTLQASSAGSCATLHDRNNNGYLDMTGIDEIDDLVFLFVNNPPVSAPEEAATPLMLHLHQNYPNPFNPSTHISYSIHASGFTSLRVYDVLGREVATLVNELKTAGRHSVRWDASGVPSGVYFYRLQSGGYAEVKKLVLLR